MQFKEGCIPQFHKTNKFGRLRMIARALQGVKKMKDESQELEREAIALVKKYRAVLYLNPLLKMFFLRLAAYLNWKDLPKEM